MWVSQLAALRGALSFVFIMEENPSIPKFFMYSI